MNPLTKRGAQTNPLNKDGHNERTFFLSRFISGIVGGLKKSREIEIASVRFASSTPMNKTESNERGTNRQARFKGKTAPEKPSTSEEKKVLLVRYGCGLSRIIRVPLLRSSSSRRTKKQVSRSFSTKLAQNDKNQLLKMKGGTNDSDDTSSIGPTVLGVTFAHPVYTGKCQMLFEDENPDTSTYLWSKIRTDSSVETDDYTLPTRKTIVEIATAESWGSVGSSSLYPTDEQSDEDGNFHYGGFDSGVNIPFDEIFTEGGFFEYHGS